jgi:lipopolysaccharide export system protein LptA
VSKSRANQSTGGAFPAHGGPSSETQPGEAQPVTTVLVQTGADHKTTLVTITSTRLTYVDSDRRIHFEGGVTMQAADAMITSRELVATLAKTGQESSQVPSNQSVGTPSRLEKAVASGNVVIQQQARKATGESLVYETSEDKFTLTGGPPSIFDAERGTITGSSLTFFRRGDRVLVEGQDNSPVITHTRMAR